MRFLTANYLYPLDISPIKEGVLVISDEGEILDIYEDRSVVPKEKLEIHDGILSPGFINAHCHLELSHLNGIAKKGQGFLSFLSVVKQRNNFNKDEIMLAIENGEQQMKQNGIVGVGDICNTADTLFKKGNENLQYYNFIETFQPNSEKISETIQYALQLRNKFRLTGKKATIVPHAPYSVPPKLMQRIINYFDLSDDILTIHMQETEEENILFEKKCGLFYNWLVSINATQSIWNEREKSTSIIHELKNKNIILVHNTFTKKEDLNQAYYCTCPKANLYIENTLPDYSIFDTDKLCVGTDSLASNDSLSILEELKVIKENSDFDINTLLKIACKNGAEALGFKKLGTFEKGKKPGINLIKYFNRIEVII